jgi:hypothetical protein
MNAFLDPAGPLPPSVYWRRRAVVLGIVVLLIAGAWTVFSAFNATPAADPAAVATPGAAVECSAKDISLRAETNQDSYAEGEIPQFAITITNTGATTCTLAVGSDKQKYVVMSGADTIWDSTVCQTGAEPYIQELSPGQSVTTSQLPWGRTYSDNCDTGTPAVGGGSSYQLTVYIGDIASAEAKQFMLY